MTITDRKIKDRVLFELEDVPGLIREWRDIGSERLLHLANQLEAMYIAGDITLDIKVAN